MGTLIKPRTTTGTTVRGKSTIRGAGGFKFQYRPRSPEEIQERAQRQIGRRDSYFNNDVQFFTPREGINTVRILPPPPDADWKHYGVGITVHYSIGADNSAYLCLAAMKNEACPLCDERTRASAAGEEQLADDLAAGERVAIYVIDRAQEGKGVMLWNLSAGIDKDVTKLQTDPGSGEVLYPDDPDHGYDLSFTREGTGLKTKYKGIQFARRESPLSDEPERAESWLKFVCAHPIDQMLTFYDYDYMKKILEGQAPPSEETEATAQPDKADGKQATKAPLTRRQVPARTKKADDVPTWEELEQMGEDLLAGLVEEFKLTPPADGFGSVDELREWVATQLEVAIPTAAAPAVAAADEPAAKGNWRDRLKKMQGK